MHDDDEFGEVRTSRRAHRSRRIDALREWHSGVVDELPTKERFSREFKKAKIKQLKNPVANIGEENCVEGLVIEVHRRTCEVRLAAPAAGDAPETVTAMYRATTSSPARANSNGPAPATASTSSRRLPRTSTRW